MKKNKRKKSKKNSFFNNIKSFFNNLTKTNDDVKDNDDSENIREVVVEKNNGFTTSEVIVIIFITTIFGLVCGYALSSSRSVNSESSENALEIVETYESILENYYGEVDEEELLNAAVSGMIDTLDDPYSLFMTSDTSDEFNETVDGSFVGVGVTVEWCDNTFRIAEVLSDSPAEKAKLEVNDYIIKVDDTSVEGMTLDEVSDLIRGEKGTKVVLTVLRDNEEVTFTVKRGLVEIPSVTSEIIEENIGYITIDTFASNTSEQFEKQLKELEDEKIESLIIDVRDNPGGRLAEVNDIMDLFLGKNKVLYKLETKEKVEKVYTEDSTKRNYPVAVLVNYDSASAAEILAASFQDNYDNAILVGTVTYGKGTIQKAVKLSSGATIKYTTQKWLTPKGVWINDTGLTPEVLVEQGEDYCSNPTYSTDIQLQRAVEELKK